MLDLKSIKKVTKNKTKKQKQKKKSFSTLCTSYSCPLSQFPHRLWAHSGLLYLIVSRSHKLNNISRWVSCTDMGVTCQKAPSHLDPAYPFHTHTHWLRAWLLMHNYVAVKIAQTTWLKIDYTNSHGSLLAKCITSAPGHVCRSAGYLSASKRGSFTAEFWSPASSCNF